MKIDRPTSMVNVDGREIGINQLVYVRATLVSAPVINPDGASEVFVRPIDVRYRQPGVGGYESSVLSCAIITLDEATRALRGRSNRQ